jgi:glycosyltransferase involved in cell wall biosynthesis
LARDLAITNPVQFLGFTPPHKIPQIAATAHAFVAPFENTGRMPYVAHTKLCEYATWGRPIIAPNLPIVTEHFKKGVLLFEPGNAASLASCLTALTPSLRQQLQSEISTYSGIFSWHTRAQTYKDILYIPAAYSSSQLYKAGANS